MESGGNPLDNNYEILKEFGSLDDSIFTNAWDV